MKYYYLKPEYYHLYGLIDRSDGNYIDDNYMISVNLVNCFCIIHCKIHYHWIYMDYGGMYSLKTFSVQSFIDKHRIIVNYVLGVCKTTSSFYEWDNLYNQYLCKEPPCKTEIDLKTDLYLLRGNL